MSSQDKGERQERERNKRERETRKTRETSGQTYDELGDSLAGTGKDLYDRTKLLLVDHDNLLLVTDDCERTTTRGACTTEQSAAQRIVRACCLHTST